MTRFQFVADHRDTFEVKRMCQVLQVCRSGFYAWVDAAPVRAARQQADEALAERVRAVHAISATHRAYGAPRVTAELNEAADVADTVATGSTGSTGRVNHKRVARVMTAFGIAGVRLRRRVVTTVPDPDTATVPDLLERDFTACSPNLKYVGDITYLPCAGSSGARGGGSFLYLATVIPSAEDALQKLIDAEATATIGAGRYERTQDRTALRNGTRAKTFSTTAGDLQLRLPKLRTGSFYPSLLERRRRIDVALFAVVAEAYVHGVSTRKVDDLVAALGVASGISKSEVSRICADLDIEVAAFRTRPLGEPPYPYVFLDATYCKARVGHRVVSRAVVIATGVTAAGHREVLGVDVGDSEDEAFWKAFLTSLKRRGLSGVQLVISDAHEGLKRAITKAMSGASWQRCRVHFARNLLAHVAKADGEVVTAAYRTVFAQPTAAGVMSQWDSIAATFQATHPKVAAVMDGAREDVLAFTSFPAAHWKKIWSTNPLERLNKEVKRRTDVVGVFPNDAALLRLTSCVLIEAHDEWAAGDRRYLSEASMAALNGTNIAELPAAITTQGAVIVA